MATISLSPRIEIVFSVRSSVSNFSLVTFVYFPHLPLSTHRGGAKVKKKNTPQLSTPIFLSKETHLCKLRVIYFNCACMQAYGVSFVPGMSYSTWISSLRWCYFYARHLFLGLLLYFAAAIARAPIGENRRTARGMNAD